MLDQGYWLALHALPGIGRVRLSHLMANFPTGQAAWEAKASQLQEIGFPKSLAQEIFNLKSVIDPLVYWQEFASLSINWIFFGQPEYPQALTNLPDPPLILYYQGQLNWPEPAISVVGSRKLTNYGRGVTERVSQALVNVGVTIISGLAYGADTIAHQSAVNAKRATVAVLGSGLNQLYPTDNQHLAKSILEYGGAIISEYPPNQPPIAGNFPSRNRIIAALGQSTIVTEASLKSGSLITARMAIELGRDVYAVPGPINSTQSAGANQLLKQGAGIITSLNDLLIDMDINLPVATRSITELSDLENQIVNLIAQQSLSADQLCQHLARPINQINSCLIKLELTGHITNIGSQTYQKNF